LATQLRLLMRNPNLLAASSGTLVNSLAFGVLFAFFPLYAAANGRTDAAIGALLAGRALASTITRIPTGLLATRLPNWLLMAVALLLMAAIQLTIVWSLLIPAWPLLLMVEGIGYGMFLVAGQSFVTKHAAPADRGAAIGIYGMAGSIGGALGPTLLGLVAAQWGLAAVFPLTGGVLLVGIVVVWLLRVPVPKIST
jgi:MFS family permease